MDKLIEDFLTYLDALIAKNSASQNIFWRSIAKKLFNEILDSIVGELDTTSGIISTENDLKEAIAKTNKIVQQIYDKEIKSDIKKILPDFDSIQNKTRKLSKDVNGNEPSKYDLNKYQQNIVDSVIDNLHVNFLAKEAIQVLAQAINYGLSIRETKELMNNVTKKPVFEHNINTAASDMITQYNGKVNELIDEEFDYKYIRYAGSLVTDSRPFCSHVINGLNGMIEKKQLGKLLSSYVGVKGKGSGMYLGTNEKNFIALRGGYYCKHVAIGTNIN